VAAPFYAQLKDIQLSDLQALWTSGVFDPANYDRLYLSEETSILFSQLWGEPSPDSVFITDPDLIPESIWIYPRALAVIPFEELLPSYSIIPVNGSDPLGSSYDDTSYPLSFPIYLEIIYPGSLEPIQIPTINNFDPAKLTSVALTGVTALVRDTAAIMEEKGILYPGEQIKDILISADIAHINNEVPFAEDCPPPDPNLDILSFCSDDTYIALLESVGADIIELSGDHFADKGPGAMLHSLELYEQNGYLTYGGGENLQAGLDPLLIEHNANRLAFIGCNAKADDMYATASETNPGASRCDFDWMAAEIQRLSSQGYLVIATMQHEEIDSFFPVALQLYDFHRLADAGAVIVSGSQAHHPQGFELSDTSFIHYGLGNLFFDQWYLASYNPEQHINKDKAMIDIHYFYDGSYLNTRLVYLQFVDNAQPRPMTSKEETSFVADLYQSSKWNERWIYLYPVGYFTTTENQ
jgi:poly-gamma-glutamate synthesis protein (capsule biosynthesis protein)